MLRRTVSSLAAGAVVATGLAFGVVTGTPATALGWNADYGRVHRDNGILRSGCKNYKYHYKVKPGTPDWGLETFLTDRRGVTVASGGLIAGQDPKKGTAKFRFCRYNTVPGRFKIRGKLTIRDGYDEKVVWVKPDRFRLRRP